MSDQKISIANGKLNVPDNPTIPFIEGDGTGVDIWPASQLVFDKATEEISFFTNSLLYAAENCIGLGLLLYPPICLIQEKINSK